MSKTELRVFLASPGGLESERDAIEQLAGTLNANFSDRLNVTIVVRRFEQRAARSGRPQAQINPWVDECDLLIALVHRRWGSSSGEGDHTGFSEEFDRAIERFESTGHPVVSLHFKAVDPESEADAGPQLAQVMAFRRRIETEHVGLYANFDSLDGLKVNVMQLLFEEIHAASESNAYLAESSSGNAIATQAPAVNPSSSGRVDTSGIAEILEAFAERIRSGEAGGNLDRDRLALFANGVARDQEVASVHLLNRTFERRRGAHLSDWELAAWFRAYISDHGRASAPEDRVIPFMLSAGKEKVATQLCDLAPDFLGSNVDMQKGYLRLLTAFRLRPEALWPAENQTSQAHWIQLGQDGLRMEVLTYWASVGSPSDLQGARMLSVNNDLAVAGLGRAIVSLLDPEQSTDPLLEMDAKVVANTIITKRLDERLLGRTSTAALQDLMKRKYLDIEVRKAAIPEIARRGAWTAETVQSLIKYEGLKGYFSEDWEPHARELLFATTDVDVIALIVEESKTLKPGDASLVLAELASANATYRSSYLAQLPDHLTAGNIEEYFALHARDSSFNRQANEILAGTFEPANRRIDRLRASGAEEYVITFVQERDIATALTHLAASGSTMSASARDLLRSIAGRTGRFRYELLMVLERIAKDEDIPTLLEALPNRWRGEPDRLQKLLSRATLTRLNSLLSNEISDIALAALKELERRERLPAQRKRKELLRHSDAEVRLFALRTLISDIPDVASFIDEYIHSAPTYYYNIVCELDRIASGAPKAY